MITLQSQQGLWSRTSSA